LGGGPDALNSKLIEKLESLPPQVGDNVVRDIIKFGVDKASEMHKFRVNRTKERRPDKRSSGMKRVVARLVEIGF
jgi:hypothetical protein